MSKMIKIEPTTTTIAPGLPCATCLWPDREESSRAAVAALYAIRARSSEDLVLLRGARTPVPSSCGRQRSFESRYTYRSQRARGISLFAASSAVESWPRSNRSSGPIRSTGGCAGLSLPKSRCSCPRSKRITGPSCSGRLAEPVGRRKRERFAR
jgi:hypothetical protein